MTTHVAGHEGVGHVVDGISLTPLQLSTNLTCLISLQWAKMFPVASCRLTLVSRKLVPCPQRCQR